MTVLAVVAAFCKAFPVEVPAHSENVAISAELFRQIVQVGIPARYGQKVSVPYPAESRPVKIDEFAWRLAWAAPLSIAAALIVRRRKPRRENGPPVG